jgi:hypothetical protein
VLDAKVEEPFVTDIVVDQTHSERLAVTPKRDGRIVDLGDLPAVAARRVIGAASSLLIPGQFTLVGDWKPGTPLDERRVAELLARGTTTAIAVIDLADREAVEALPTPQNLPFNWAFVGNADRAGLAGSALVERIAVAASNGLVAVVSSGTDETLWRHVHQFGLPLIKPAQLPAAAATTFQNAAAQAWNTASALKFHARRGRINREYFADLLFFHAVPLGDAAQPIEWKNLRRVMVAGETVWLDGRPAGPNCGIQLVRD